MLGTKSQQWNIQQLGKTILIFDLLLQLAVSQNPTQEVVKIKAHRLPEHVDRNLNGIGV